MISAQTRFFAFASYGRTAFHATTIAGHAFPDHALAMELFRGLRDDAALVARAGKLVGAGLAAAVTARDGGRAIGRAAGDLVEFHLAGEAVIQADHGHAEMQQVGDDRE